MKVSQRQKLFIVEFGKPDKGNWISFSSGGLEPIFVIAESYDEAASKAIEYAETKVENKSVVDNDDSLKGEPNKLTIKSIKLCCEEFIY